MTNSEIELARRFHEATKYRQAPRDRIPLMGIPPDIRPALGDKDPTNEPHLFKVYRELERLEIPREFAQMRMALLDAIALPGGIPISNTAHEGEPEERLAPDRAALARISLLSNGIHERAAHNGKDGLTTLRDFQYRAAGCTGGLYHLEFYLACGDLLDLNAGLYHYAADTHSLQIIRAGDHRAAIVEATDNEPAVADAPVLLMVTSTFWRNAWRYLERSYRHTYWDLGTAIAHVLALAAGEGLPAKVVMGFDDELVNRVLDVDGSREATVCVVTLGSGDRPGPSPRVTPTGHRTEPVSKTEIDFPLIREMHMSSSLQSGGDIAEWRSGTAPTANRSDSQPGVEVALAPMSSFEAPDVAVDEAIRRRKSTRRYDSETPMPYELFCTLLERSLHPIAADWIEPSAGSLVEPYLIVNSVAGLAAGSYRASSERGTLERLAIGETRAAATRLACDQAYAGDAHVNVYFLADMEPIYERYGNRGYRIAQVESAIRGGKLQLAAHALGIGTVGTTSLDDEVIDFFGPTALGKSYLFAAVFGTRLGKQTVP